MCFGCSKETSHRDGSFEYPQHMFTLRNKKNNFQLRILIWGPVGLHSFFIVDVPFRGFRSLKGQDIPYYNTLHQQLL